MPGSARSRPALSRRRTSAFTPWPRRRPAALKAMPARPALYAPPQTPHLSYPELLAVFRTQARLHDLTVVDAEPEALALDRGLIDALLMESGRPLLVVPPGQDVFRARRIILAWDGSGGPPGRRPTPCRSCGPPRPWRWSPCWARRTGPTATRAPT